MADFKQAIQWLGEGKKVRRKDRCWVVSYEHGGFGIEMAVIKDPDTGGKTSYQHFDKEDLESTNWEIYEEEIKEKELVTILEHDVIAKNIEEVSLRLKEISESLYAEINSKEDN